MIAATVEVLKCELRCVCKEHQLHQVWVVCRVEEKYI